MAVAATRVGNPTVFGNKKVGIFDLAFSGSYATGGEVLTPALFDFSNALEVVLPVGSPAEADLTGAWDAKVDYQTNGNANLVIYEAGTAGGVNTQKPAEAYESAGELRVLVIGH